MKPQDVGFVQLHIEKIVMAVAALVVLLILFVFVMGDPYAVELGRKQVSPSEAPALLRQQSDQLNQKVRSTTPPFPDRNIPDYAATFQHRSGQPSLATAQYVLPIGLPGLDPTLIGPGEDRQPYDLPGPPLPGSVIARAGYGILQPLGVEAIDRQLVELTHVADSGEPADFRYVSVGATFDFAQWIERLEKPQENKVPVAWWRPMLHIAGVFLLRQEAVDLQKDQWSAPVQIAVLPTQQAYLADMTRDFTQEEADATVNFIKEQEELILRPPFVPMRDDRAWLPPDAKQLTAEEHIELNRLQVAIARLEKQIATLQNQLDRQAGKGPAGSARPVPRSRREDPRFGEEDLRSTPRAPRTASNRSRVDGLEAQLGRLQQDLASKLIERDTLLGIEPTVKTPLESPLDDGYEIAPDPRYAPTRPREAGRFPDPTIASGPAPVEEQDLTVKVWAHDLTALPGKTYRYKVVVSVLNPLFRQNRVALAQREVQYNRLTLGPAADEVTSSPWSKPVTLDPPHYFFLIGGNDSRQLAQVEAWRLYDGTWRSAEFDIKPGDAIGGSITFPLPSGDQASLDIDTDSLAVDIVADGGRGGRAGTRLYYIASQGGAILSRTTRQDRENPVRIRLRNQTTIDEQWRAIQADQSASTKP